MSINRILRPRSIRSLLLTATMVLGAARLASAGPLISEIYFNPPGGNDVTGALEYIELRGDANLSLDNYYFITLENENDEFNSGTPGEIENIFNLAGMSFGSNGYLVLGMKGSLYPGLNGAYDVAAPANPAQPTPAESLKTLGNGAHAYVNRDTGSGYGNGTTSSIGHVGQNNDLEGSGFTAMLIYVDSKLGGVAPVLNDDLDAGNDGLDLLTGQTGWTILDSIGVMGETSETDYGRLYAGVGFGPGITKAAPGGVEPGSTYINTAPAVLELEYVARVGTGIAASNWMAANLTNDGASGYTNGARNYAISGDHGNQSNPEVYVGSTLGASPFAYGTDITVTLGADNVGFVVPEPSSLALAGLGGAIALALAVTRRRQPRAS